MEDEQEQATWQGWLTLAGAFVLLILTGAAWWLVEEPKDREPPESVVVETVETVPAELIPAIVCDLESCTTRLD